MLTQALERLERLIEEQRTLGIRGLHLAASYETRARIAGWMHDRAAFTRYAQLSAAEYATEDLDRVTSGRAAFIRQSRLQPFVHQQVGRLGAVGHALLSGLGGVDDRVDDRLVGVLADKGVDAAASLVSARLARALGRAGDGLLAGPRRCDHA